MSPTDHPSRRRARHRAEPDTGRGTGHGPDPRGWLLALTVVATLGMVVLALPGAAPARAQARPSGFGGTVSVSAAQRSGLPGRLATATTSAVPQPATPSGLPVGIESLQPYVAASSCDPRAKSGPEKLGALLVVTYPGTSFNVSRPCGSDSLSTSEHYEGRALDWMVRVRDPLGAARADAVIDWLLATDDAGNPYANLRRLGIMYVIWNDRIWGAYAPSAGWRAYSSCAAHPEPSWDTRCHRDHVHLSFGWSGAQARTSFWTRGVATPDYGPCRAADLNWAAPWSGVRTTRCPSYTKVSSAPGAGPLLRTLTRFSGAQVGPGQTGPVVTAVQKVLGTTADGDFGPGTLAALHAFQAARAVPLSDVVDSATWRAILAVQQAADAAQAASQGPGAADGGSAATG